MNVLVPFLVIALLAFGLRALMDYLTTDADRAAAAQRKEVLRRSALLVTERGLKARCHRWPDIGCTSSPSCAYHEAEAEYRAELKSAAKERGETWAK